MVSQLREGRRKRNKGGSNTIFFEIKKAPFRK